MSFPIVVLNAQLVRCQEAIDVLKADIVRLEKSVEASRRLWIKAEEERESLTDAIALLKNEIERTEAHQP